MTDRAADVIGRLGSRCEARAINIGDRIDPKGIEPRLSQFLPVIVEVAPGCAVVLRSGAVVFFGVDAAAQERFVAELGPRVQGRYDRQDVERAVIRRGDSDGVDPDAIVLKEISVERLQVVAEILGKSVVLARYELEIAEAFRPIEPLAAQMKTARRMPWKQRDLVRHIGETILIEHKLVGSAEVPEKPELIWDRPELDRLYARLDEEYELRERYLVVERKLAVVSGAVRTMLDLHQTKRSLHVEYYIVGLIFFEIVLGLVELAAKYG